MSIFVDVAMRTASILQNHDFLFADVALRPASILKIPDVFAFLIFPHVAQLLYLAGFEPWEYARTISFEKVCKVH